MITGFSFDSSELMTTEKNCPDCEGRHDLDNYTQFNDLTLDE